MSVDAPPLRRDHSRRDQGALLSTAELGSGWTKDFGHDAFGRKVGHEPMRKVKTVLCGLYVSRCVIDDKARGAVALADVVGTGATVLNVRRLVVCIGYRVCGVSRSHNVDHVFGQLSGARSDQIDKRKSY